jgi:hypothetical protein
MFCVYRTGKIIAKQRCEIGFLYLSRLTVDRNHTESNRVSILIRFFQTGFVFIGFGRPGIHSFGNLLLRQSLLFAPFSGVCIESEFACIDTAEEIISSSATDTLSALRRTRLSIALAS